MLSRVADSLCWMSRYLERAEHTARVIDVNLGLMLEQAPEVVDLRWPRVIESLGFQTTPGPMDAYSISKLLTFQASNLSSIVSSIRAARENARQVREQISSEMWEEINRLYLAVQKRQPVDSEWTAGTHEFLSATINGVHQIQGVTDATMTHGEGWHYIELGRYLERASATAALLDVQFREAPPDAGGLPGVSEFVEWVGLLKSCCAFEAYCRHYTADVRPQRIAEFLVLNPEFPRSIHFAAARVQAALRAIAGLTGRTNGRSERLAGRLLASLDYGQIDEIMGELPSYLQGIVRQAALINSAVHQQYIAYPIDIGLA